MELHPYLNFDGRCEEAIGFYTRAVGAEVKFLMRYSDSPEPCAPGMIPPGAEKKIMHATFRIGDTEVMASDCHCAGKVKYDGISLALNVPTEAVASRVFAALSDGGTVQMPLSKTFFSPSFGVLTDRFGISWMIHVPGPEPKSN
jgi:PhnB protein